ncbi:MAG: hypothetical protein QXX19_05320 [Candidatus Caldarchaeum sp.]
MVGVPIFLLVVNLGLWWGGEALSDYAREYPATHFFIDDYEPQTLLEITENVVSGAHRAVGLTVGGIIGNIFNNKQDFKEVLEKSTQPKDHYLGLIHAGDYCVITSETSGEIWCRRVIKAGERDGIVYWSWPPQTERPYLFTRLLPQLFLNSTNQPQINNIETLVQRHQVYWLKPSTKPQLQYQTGYFYEQRLKNTVLMSQAESVGLWTKRLKLYQQIQMFFVVLLFVASPISLTILYKDRVTSLLKRLRKWKRQRDAKRQGESEHIFIPKVVEEGGKMAGWDDEEEKEPLGTGLVPKSYYPAKASNPLMGTLLSLGLRWKIGTEIENIERLTELITVKTKLSEVSVQQLEAEKQLVIKLAECGGITPKLINKLRSQGYYRLVELLQQKQELQDLDHEDAVLTKKLAITEKQRKLEELKKPKRRLSRREQEEREIKQIMTETYSRLRKNMARVAAAHKAANKAKEHFRKSLGDNAELLEDIERMIDMERDNLIQNQGTEYEEDEDIL